MQLGWIWTDNLRPLLVEISVLVGCRFDDDDWIAVEYGIGGTDSERGPWFDYPVGPLSVEIASEPGANEMVSVKVVGAEADHEQRLAWLADIMRDWHLRR